MQKIYDVDFPPAMRVEKSNGAVDRSYGRVGVVGRAARSAKIKAFVIHLDCAHGRALQVEKLISGLPVPGEVIEAVDGSSLSKADIESVYRRHLHKPSYPFKMNDNEIACFISHRRAWTAIVEQGLDAGLVIEDDVELDEAFPAAFAAARACLAPGAFIRFPFRNDREHGDSIFVSEGASVIRPRRIGLGMVAQLVSRDAAICLLQATALFDRPVDTTMQMEWVTHLSPLAVLPGGVQEISSMLGGSTIKRRKTLADRLAREILRPLYRAKVAMRSRYPA